MKQNEPKLLRLQDNNNNNSTLRIDRFMYKKGGKSIKGDVCVHVKTTLK